MPSPHAERPGFTLVELLVVMAITSLLATVLFGTLLAQLRLARTVTENVAARDAVRTTVAVVGGELRRAVSQDVRAVAEDSLAMRAFRGVGFICGLDAGVLVRYRGDRLPDPTKDSVLVVRTGGHAALLLTGYEAAPAHTCAVDGDEQSLRLQVEGGTAVIEDAAALLIFEPGNYYLASHALRYRLGREGRQPLTAERFLHPGTAFQLLSGGASLAIRLTTAHKTYGPRPLSFSPPLPDVP